MELFKKRPLAAASLLFILSSLIAFFLNRNGISCLWVLFPFLFFFLTTLLFLLFKRRNAILPLLLLGAVVLAFFTQYLYDRRAYEPWREASGGARHAIIATVDTVEKVGASEVSYSISVEELDGEPTRIRLLLITNREEGTLLVPYTRIAAEVFLRDRATPYLYTSGVAGIAEADGIPHVLPKDGRGLEELLSSLRATLSARIREGLSGDSAAYYSALFLGDRTALSDEVTASFQRSGTVHLLALSGMHLSVLALFWLRLLRALGAPNSVSFSLLVLFLLLYTGISGFPLSLVRAALMMLLYRLALLSRLSADAFTSLTFAVALILLFSPSSAIDIGLHLSFLATLAILVANELFRERKKKKGLIRALTRLLLFSLFSSLLAILFTLLLSLLTFGKFSLMAIPANLLLSPLVTLSLLLSPFLLLFPSALGGLARPLGELVISLSGRISSVRGSYVLGTYPLFLVALTLFSLYLIFLLVGKLRTKKALLLRFGIALAALSLVFLGCHTYHRSRDVLLYTRSFQDEYITVRAEGRVTVVANTVSHSSLAALEDTLNDAYIGEIDRLILSHYEDGAAEFLEAIKARFITGEILLLPPKTEDDPYYREALLASEYLGLTVSPLTASEVTFDGVLWRIEPLYRHEGSHPDLLLSVTHDAKKLCFASPGALLIKLAEEREEFVGDADVLILGAHPGTGEKEPPLTLPENCLLLAAYPGQLPVGLTVKAECLLCEPTRFSYPLKK